MPSQSSTRNRSAGVAVAGNLADQGDEAPVRAPVRAQPEGAGDPSRQAGTAGVQVPSAWLR